MVIRMENFNFDKFITEKANELLAKSETSENKSDDSSETVIQDVPKTENKDVSGSAMAAIDLAATNKAIQDEELVKGVTDRKKASILNRMDADMKNEEAENKKAETRLQEANYGVYSGVANYAGIKRPLPGFMQKTLFVILSFFQIVFLTLFGVPTSVINIAADAIDSIVKKLTSITKSARILVLSAIVLFVVLSLSLIIVSWVRTKFSGGA